MRRTTWIFPFLGLAALVACTEYVHVNDESGSGADAGGTGGAAESTGVASTTTPTTSTGSSTTTGGEPTGEWDALVEAAAPLDWWRFDELEGSVAIDHGSGAYDGTYSNGITLDQEAPRGRRGAHFNGGTLAGVVIDAPPLAAPWTVEAVFFSDDTAHPVSSALLSVRNVTGNTAIKVEQYSGTGRLGVTIYGQTDQTFGLAPTPVEYTHVVFVCGAQTLCVYLGGESVECRAFTMPLSRGAIGGAAGTGGWGDAFGGTIDELVIYDRALTDAEIATHAAAAI